MHCQARCIETAKIKKEEEMSEVDLTAITQVSVGLQNGFGAGTSASFGPALRLNDDKKTLLATQVYGVLGFNGEVHDKPVVITDAEGNS
ncbi:MAG: hypothetical protein HY539_06010, partial [Deltaproteobacteria bacterium]|nr:hypothetical protein [Deltaproteobacteria bacterium]